MRRATAVTALLTLLVLWAGLAPAGARAAPAGGPQLFDPGSFWNARLSDRAPVDRRSRPLVRELRRQVRAVLAQRRGPWIGTRDASTPIYVVPAGQPEVRVALEQPELWWRSPLQRAFEHVPLPAGARPAPGADAHLVVWQPASDRLWEFFGLARGVSGWHARWGGAMAHVSRSGGYYRDGVWPGARAAWAWGATGTSLPVAGGVVRVAELRGGRIDHALALNLPSISATRHSWPAQRSDGRARGRDAIPQGARFRLDPRVDLDRLGLPRPVLALARAAQRHGMVVRDTSSTVAVYAETPTGDVDPYPELLGRSYPDNLHQLMARFPWRHLQLLRLDLCPRTPAGPCELRDR